MNNFHFISRALDAGYDEDTLHNEIHIEMLLLKPRCGSVTTESRNLLQYNSNRHRDQKISQIVILIKLSLTDICNNCRIFIVLHIHTHGDGLVPTLHFGTYTHTC